MLQIKVVERWILYKKVSGRICLSPFSMGLEGAKDCHLLKYYNVQRGRFTLRLDAAENMHHIQKCFEWRKSRLWGLLMFSNVFQELSVSLSVVNFFKVTNLCKNDIHICKIWRDAWFFGFKIWLNFTSPSNFMMSQKVKPLFPNISIQHPKIQKQNS